MMYYDQWSKLLRKECTKETMQKCPTSGYLSLENINYILKINPSLIEFIPDDRLYDSDVVEMIAEKSKDGHMELPIEFIDNIDPKYAAKIILNSKYYGVNLFKRIEDMNNKIKINDYIKMYQSGISEDKLDRINELNNRLDTLNSISPEIHETINDIINITTKYPKIGMNIIDSMINKQSKNNIADMEYVCIKYIQRKHKSSINILRDILKE